MIVSVSSPHNPSRSNMDSVSPNEDVYTYIKEFRGPPTPLQLCLPVLIGTEPHPQFGEAEASSHHEDFNQPYIVPKRVSMFVQRWGRVVAMDPVIFLHNILEHRGYDTELIPPCTAERRRPPTTKQLSDYTNELVGAVRNSDLVRLKSLHAQGKSLTACNKFSESIVHMACRRSTYEVVQFMLDNGADLTILDDYGRTPLHDACWRQEPCFEVVTLILDKNLDLIRCYDVRGSIPLHYVRQEHWIQWCAYLFNQVEKYWAPRQSSIPNHKRQKLESEDK